MVPLSVKVPSPLSIVKLSALPPAPSIGPPMFKVPSLVVLLEVTVTVPEIITSPPLVTFKAIFGFAASAVSIVMPLAPPVKVMPSRPSTVTVRISSALPIFPVIFTVSLVLEPLPPLLIASRITVSLLVPMMLPTVIAPPLESISMLALSSKFIVPVLKLILLLFALSIFP